MTARSCPDWPHLMEIAPELQFKHYTLAEAKLPAEVLVAIREVSLEPETICCDLDHHVFNRLHTDPEVGEALAATHWFDLGEWATTGPGASTA
jgi:hypothetical protein